MEKASSGWHKRSKMILITGLGGEGHLFILEGNVSGSGNTFRVFLWLSMVWAGWRVLRPGSDLEGYFQDG